MRDDSLKLDEIDNPPPWPGANDRLILGSGAWIDPIKRLAIFSFEEFEIFVLQWVSEYLKKRVISVNYQGGPGDKGRDIIAWLDDINVEPRRWNLYQCKHYGVPIAPSDIWVELGKLCYYTFNHHYTIPENYYLVAPKGVGPTLQDLINNPKKINIQLMENWNQYCRTKITKSEEVSLEGDFYNYVKKFDFSIIRSIPPHELIEQHSKTRYHSFVFGISLKPRPKPPVPPADIDPKESIYIQQIFEPYSDYLEVLISKPEDFELDEELMKFYQYSRICFYCAEALKEFTRDTLPDESFYYDILDQIHQGIMISLIEKHPDAYEKMKKTCEQSIVVPISGNILQNHLKPNDKIGICHHLVNEERIKWVINDN